MSASLIAPRWDTKSPPSASRRVTIGFDYGTCSTKVQVRWRGESRSQVILVDDAPTPDYPAFATPSAVRVRGDRLFFGRRAVTEAGGDFYKSLKVQLLPPDRELGQESGGFPPWIGPELLIGCYLSWALGAVVRRLGVLPGNVALNVAAPMNHIEDTKLKGRNLHIIQAAWEAVFGVNPIRVDQGARLDDVRDFFNTWLGREVPDLAHRRFEVLPETIAPIVSLSLDPRMEPGMYLMVDMGAGTTEYSINQVTSGGGDQNVNCYSDRSLRIGGDDFDVLPTRADRHQASTKLLKRFGSGFHQTWHSGYGKDRAPAAKPKWRRLRVILTGGGARNRDIQELLRRALPKNEWSVAEASYKIAWHHPTGLNLDGLPERPAPEDLPLLAVSHGLSVERQSWPVYHKPGEIEHQAPPIVIWSPVTSTYPDDK